MKVYIYIYKLDMINSFFHETRQIIVYNYYYDYYDGIFVL